MQHQGQNDYTHAYVRNDPYKDRPGSKMIRGQGIGDETCQLENSYHGTGFHAHNRNTSIDGCMHSSKRTANMALIMKNPKAYKC